MQSCLFVSVRTIHARVKTAGHPTPITQLNAEAPFALLSPLEKENHTSETPFAGTSPDQVGMQPRRSGETECTNCNTNHERIHKGNSVPGWECIHIILGDVRVVNAASIL